MRLVFKVKYQDRVVVFVSFGHPAKCFLKLFGCDVAVVPDIVIVSLRVRLCTVDIYHYLDTVRAALAYYIIKYLKAVHRFKIEVCRMVKVCGRVFSRFPLQQKLCRDRYSEKVEAMVRDGF